MLAASAFAQGQAAPAKSDGPASTPSREKANQEKAAPTAKSPKPDSLKALEDTLFKPLQDSLNPDRSLDPPLARPPRANTPAQEKKLRDALDRKKNWVFMTPEEMLVGQNPNELLGEEGKSDEEKNMTPMQRYMYRRLYPSKDSKANNPNSKRDPWDARKDSLRDRMNGSADRNDSENPEERKEKAERKDPDKDSRKQDEPKNRSTSIFSDIFGISRPEITKEQERAEKARLDAFKQSLGLPVAPSFDAKSFSPFASLPEPSPAAALPPAAIDTTSSTSTKPSGLTPQLGTIPALPSLPTVTPASTLQPFGGPSLTPSLPVPEPTRTLPPQPTFTAPRRSF
jgi:hypothetical protein